MNQKDIVYKERKTGRLLTWSKIENDLERHGIDYDLLVDEHGCAIPSQKSDILEKRKKKQQKEKEFKEYFNIPLLSGSFVIFYKDKQNNYKHFKNGAAG